MFALLTFINRTLNLKIWKITARRMRRRKQWKVLNNNNLHGGKA
jgi:hypothetical protein